MSRSTEKTSDAERFGGPGSSHQDRAHPGRNHQPTGHKGDPAPERPVPGEPTNGRRSSSGHSGERDLHQSHDPADKS